MTCSTMFLFVLSVAAPQLARTRAPLPVDARPLEETDRYRTSRSYPETLAYYRRLFAPRKGVSWTPLVNSFGVRALHIESLRPTTSWSGINVYEKDGQTRIYVLARKPKEGV